MQKITESNGYLIGGAGSSRFCDVIQYAWTPPTYDNTNMFGFMVATFVPAMRKAHEEAGCVPKDDEVFKFIVGVNHRLFYISEDYSVVIGDTPYYGVGTGAQYAVGALEAGCTVKGAMKIAAKYDINTGGAVKLFNRGQRG
jgi:hypothetical protein